MDKCVQAYNLITKGDSLEIGLDQRVADIKRQLKNCNEQLRTAKRHGLGENVMAQTLVLNVKAELVALRRFVDVCIEQIDETQDNHGGD